MVAQLLRLKLRLLGNIFRRSAWQVVGIAVGLIYGTAALDRLGLPAEPGHARPLGDGVVYVDPRLASLGARALLPRATAAGTLAAAGAAPGTAAGYDRLRLSLGVPDGSRDLPVEKAILLENGFDELHGIDWNKGCYIGQEIIARIHFRGHVAKQLSGILLDAAGQAETRPVGSVPVGTELLSADGKTAGRLTSITYSRRLGKTIALGYIRYEHLAEGTELSAGDAKAVVTTLPFI